MPMQAVKVDKTYVKWNLILYIHKQGDYDDSHKQKRQLV